MNPGQAAKRLKLTYLGQAGLILDSGQTRIVFDPYLSNYVVTSGIGSAELFSRAFPPPAKAEELSGIDVIFLSHDHADHCDPDTILPLYKANPSVRFVCPRPVARHLQQLGISDDNIVVPEALKLSNLGVLAFYAVPAAHYDFDCEPVTGEYAYFGFVVKIGEKCLFHAGDTITYKGFTENILRHVPGIDIACLPINGRDAKREEMGIVGNLTGREAYALAKEIDSVVLIPLHNDLFPFNSEDPKPLMEMMQKENPSLKIKWMKPGQTLET